VKQRNRGKLHACHGRQTSLDDESGLIFEIRFKAWHCFLYLSTLLLWSIILLLTIIVPLIIEATNNMEFAAVSQLDSKGVRSILCICS
jgi:hypothetical protein